jgi:hypothetical protein
MASSYLTLYGNYEKKTWQRNSNVWRSPVEQASQVVHDKANNIYYGIHSQADTVKYLTQAIAESQRIANSTHGTRYVRRGRGGRNETYAYSAAEKRQHQQTLANQQKYLKHINSGGYKREANTFFDSYDEYSGDWNNVFVRRKENADKTEKNRLQEIKNEKTRARNKKIEGENQIREAKALQQQDTQMATGSKAKVKTLKPNLEIGTGISAAADSLVKSLNTGLSI